MTANKCPNCGLEIPENIFSCPNCGYLITNAFSIVQKNELTLLPDPEFDYEDVKCQFEPQVPFYEKTDYAVAIASGLLTAGIDILLVGNSSLQTANTLGTEEVNKIVIKVAKKLGFKGDTLKGAIEFLEKHFPHPGDTVMSHFGGATQHHLRDFSHHPTIVGLCFSLLTQFTGRVYGTDALGNFISVPVPNGMFIGKTIPEKILFATVHWMLHLISDMAGSSGSIGKRSGGTGIPGPLLAFLKEVSALPFFKNLKNEDGINKLSLWIAKLFNGTKTPDGVRIDLRTELGVLYKQITRSLPVIANELIVRGYFMVSRLYYEISSKNIKIIKELDKIDITAILPFKQRKLYRMLTLSSGTFFITTTAAAIAKGVASEDYASIFINLNYSGILRFAVAIKQDSAFIADDIKQMKKDIEERNEQRYKFYAEQNLGTSYFILNANQGLILDSLKKQKIEYDISKSTPKKTISKKKWQNRWIEKTQCNGELITDETNLYLSIHDEVKKSKSSDWMYLEALELLRFKPYFPYGDNVEEDKEYKTLRLQTDYETDVFTIMQNYVDRIEYKKLCDTMQKYNNLLDGTNQKLAAGVASTAIMTVVTGGLAYAFAPAIAVGLAGNSFVGLYGAALTNASLAAIGGGALASGGMGMAGGTAIITGGGALLSFLGSGSTTAALSFMSSKGSVVAECASMLTYCKVVLLQKEEGVLLISNVRNSLENNKREYESSLSMMKASKSPDKDNKLIKTTESNLKYISMTIKELDKMIKEKNI